VDKGHGRKEVRQLISTTALNGYLDWPGVGPVFELERVRVLKGKTEVVAVYGITSLKRDAADAAALLALVRGHWGIENNQSDDPQSAGLCATGGSGYHHPRRSSGAGRMVRPAPRSRRRPMSTADPVLPPARRQRLQRLLAELMTRSVTGQAAQPREGRHDHLPA
jgi:hypothetical protein